MTQLPEDIANKIKQLFPGEIDRASVQKQLLTLWTRHLNVGADQLARSILMLAVDDLTKFEEIFASNFYGDPRDVIVNAAIKNGQAGHYFTQPFTDDDLQPIN